MPALAWLSLGTAAVLGLYGIAVWHAPRLLNQRLLNDTSVPAHDRLLIENDTRVMVISLGGAIVFGISLLYTARSYRLTRLAQTTDRFTKALECLSSPEIYVRVGGIYALDHIMRDSPDHHREVVEVLINFIRHRTPHADASIATRQPAIYPHPLPPDSPNVETQVTLDILGRRPDRPDRERGHLALPGG